jgi:hypothetical protein
MAVKPLCFPDTDAAGVPLPSSVPPVPSRETKPLAGYDLASSFQETTLGEYDDADVASELNISAIYASVEDRSMGASAPGRRATMRTQAAGTGFGSAVYLHPTAPYTGLDAGHAVYAHHGTKAPTAINASTASLLAGAPTLQLVNGGGAVVPGRSSSSESETDTEVTKVMVARYNHGWRQRWVLLVFGLLLAMGLAVGLAMGLAAMASRSDSRGEPDASVANKAPGSGTPADGGADFTFDTFDPAAPMTWFEDLDLGLAEMPAYSLLVFSRETLRISLADVAAKLPTSVRVAELVLELYAPGGEGGASDSNGYGGCPSSCTSGGGGGAGGYIRVRIMLSRHANGTVAEAPIVLTSAPVTKPAVGRQLVVEAAGSRQVVAAAWAGKIGGRHHRGKNSDSFCGQCYSPCGPGGSGGGTSFTGLGALARNVSSAIYVDLDHAEVGATGKEWSDEVTLGPVGVLGQSYGDGAPGTYCAKRFVAPGAGAAFLFLRSRYTGK